MRFVVRLLLFVVGVTLAISAGTTFLFFASIFDPVLGELAAAIAFVSFVDAVWAIEDPAELVILLAGMWGVAIALLVAPPTLVALIGEVARIGSFVWYCGATGALTAVLPWLARGEAGAASAAEMRVTLALFLTGAVAGFVYWLVAGRSAGGPEPVTAPASRES